MTRSTLLAVCVVAVMMLSSAANATLVWTSPYSLSGPWGINPTIYGETYIPQYDPLMYGGAELQAIRFDLTTEVLPIDYAVGNPTDNWVYGLATVSAGFEIFDPRSPSTVYAQTQHTLSQWMTVPSGTYVERTAPASMASAVGIMTDNLAPFVGAYYSPVAIGVRSTNDSSWAGTEGAQLMYSFAGLAAINVYYGYDDGTPERVPEPGTLLLMGAGLPALGFLRRKRTTTSG